jgi:ABC-type transport system involved in multi-copper enzyme maturation permease subunit
MLVSRVLNLLMVLLAGLPVLMIIQFLGGIDPDLLLAGYAATGLTIASLAGLSILVSVYARRSYQAIAASYLLAVGYLAITGLFTSVVDGVPSFARYPSTDDWVSPIVMADVVEWASAGNIGVALWRLFTANRGMNLETLLPDLLQSYAWFHGVLFLTCAVWATLRLRAVARRQWSGPGRRAARHIRNRETIPVGRWAMVWKEVTFERWAHSGFLIRLGTGLLVAASLLPAAAIVSWFIYYYLASGWDQLGEAMSHWAEVAGTIVASLLWLQVALRAATCVTGERSKQTLDALLTTPLESNAILFGKWLGSVLRPGWGLLWLSSIWVIAWLTGGLSPWAIPCLAVAWLVFATFFAGLGLWFSVVSRTTLHALVGTILAIAVVTLGHWLLAPLYVGLAHWLFDVRLHDFAENFHTFGLTPPLTLDALMIPYGERLYERHWGEPWLEGLVMACFGVAIYGLGAYALWRAAYGRFRRISNRAMIPPVVPTGSPGTAPGPCLPEVACASGSSGV